MSAFSARYIHRGTDRDEDVFPDEKCWYFKNIYDNAEKNYYRRRFEPEGG